MATLICQVVRNYLGNVFDKVGVLSRLELAMYVADHGRVTGTKPAHQELGQVNCRGFVGGLQGPLDAALLVLAYAMPDIAVRVQELEKHEA